MNDKEFKKKLGDPPSYQRAIQQFERDLLRTALAKAKGFPSRAAKLIGLKHQTLLNRLALYPEIKRTPVRKRRRPLIDHYLVITSIGPNPADVARTIVSNLPGKELKTISNLISSAPGDIRIRTATFNKARTIARQLKRHGATATAESLPKSKTSKSQAAANSVHS
jgi:hypothetical protein